MDEKTLQAVLDDDLINFLKSIGQLDNIKNGFIFCTQCGTIITVDNIQLIIPKTKIDFEFVCNDIKCIEKYYERKVK